MSPKKSSNITPKMAGDSKPSNPLVEPGKAATSLKVQLHPLVLLNISDYITRHTLRQQQGLIVGAVIGQQNGRQQTLEHAYECKFGDDGTLDGPWFKTRLEAYKEVHKAPALDLNAVFMLGKASGPEPAHVQVLEQVQKLAGADSNNLLLLLFHSEASIVGKLQGGKLPISLYETVQENVSGGDGSAREQMKFRELAFEVETGEAEMIAVDFVAKGGGNATAVQGTKKDEADAGSKEKKSAGKGKGKAKDEDTEINGVNVTSAMLSPEDEDKIANLTAKANAIKMLNQRINLIRTYLTTIPESYLTDAESDTPAPEGTNHALLRNISALLSRLQLLATAPSFPIPSLSNPVADTTPSQSTTVTPLELAARREREDVHVTSLLASLTRAVSEAQSLGGRFAVVQREKQAKDRAAFTRSMGPPKSVNMGMGDDSSLLSAGEEKDSNQTESAEADGNAVKSD